ncbi:unnamed protein product [Blepharisma stoltei]|uniref:FHA domain-containing protein n=1 Tax=Blepharisma stoltei TaxID=1481888 RepID=A0AAU9KCF6_9CILI|nr:unnamed protein product [Blepharisma stoltei]
MAESLKITITNNLKNALVERYEVASKGLRGSRRDEKDGILKIGRGISDEWGNAINDICLSSDDSAISRKHCELEYQFGFKGTIPLNFFNFLLARLPKNESRSVWYNLPIEICILIFEFFKEPTGFYAKDLGSKFGTFIRIGDEGVVLKSNYGFRIGESAEFSILECQYTHIDYTDRFFRGISRGEKVLIHQDYVQYVDMDRSDYPADEKPGFPYLDIRIKDDSTTKERWFKVIATEKKSVFTIGRSEEADMPIDQSSKMVSRIQCVLIYSLKDQEWRLTDGDGANKSSNGTWLNLQYYQEQNPLGTLKPKSMKLALPNKCEMRISQQFLTFELTKNNHDAKKEITLKKRV